MWYWLLILPGHCTLEVTLQATFLYGKGLRAFADDNFNVANIGQIFFDMVDGIFSFSHNVFERLLSHNL